MLSLLSMGKGIFNNSGQVSRTSAPPVGVWIATLLIIAALAALSAQAYRNAPAEDARYIAYERDRIRSFAELSNNKKKARKVIALGTSLLACATYFDKNMEAFSLISGNGPVNFLRITRPGMSIDQISSYMDEIIASRPDILIIERDILFYRTNRVYTMLLNHADFVRRSLREIAGSVVGIEVASADHNGPANIMDSDGELEKLLTRKPPFLEQFREGRQMLTGPDQYANRRLVEDFLDRASKSGIKLVLLHIPRSPEADALIPNSEKALISSYEALYQKQYNLITYGYPGKLDLSYYMDYSHLNSNGKELFSRWLLSQIGEIDTSGERS